MLFITILAACALAAASHHEVPMDSEDPRHPEEKHQFSVATSPFDFFDKSQALPVTFTQGMRTPIDPGIKLEIEAVGQKSPPEISPPNGVVDDRSYVIIMVSPDGKTPCTLLWLQSNLIKDPKNGPQSMIPRDNTIALTKYREPQPPKGEEYYRYTLLLFEQPANFTIPSKFDRWIGPRPKTRIHFDVRAFVTDTGLPQPVAANTFFTRD